MQTFRLSTFAALSLLLAVFPATLHAQQTNMMPRRLNAEAQAGGGQGAGIVGRFMQGPQNQIIRVLTEEQTASLRQIMQSQRANLTEAESKLVDARKDLMLVSVAEKFDENLIRAKAATVAKLETEMSVLRARIFSQIKPPLTADQVEKLKNAPAPNGGPRMRPRQNGPATDAGVVEPSLRPAQRTIQRDENDLPMAAPGGR